MGWGPVKAGPGAAPGPVPSYQRDIRTLSQGRNPAMEALASSVAPSLPRRDRVLLPGAAGAMSRDRRDAGIRERYAQRHPEDTGGTDGAMRRTQNTLRVFEASAPVDSPSPLKPARLSPQELNAELRDRRSQGNYAMPGSVEDTIAALEARREVLKQM